MGAKTTGAGTTGRALFVASREHAPASVRCPDLMAEKNALPRGGVMPPRSGRRALYRGAHPIRRALLMANATTETKCWRCGKTLAEHRPHKNGKPATWDAGHIIDGDPLSPLALEASTCNRSAGGRAGAAARWRKTPERQSPNA